MSKEFAARRLDVKSFAEEGGALSGETRVGQHTRLMAETQGRGAEARMTWSATGEGRNPHHVQPEIWLHLKADATLSLTCQRCLSPVDVPVRVQRSFRFVPNEDMAAAQDDQSEEDVLALSRSFDVVELVEDELLMELPLAPRHETCPPVNFALSDAGFDESQRRVENPFAPLGRFRPGK